MGDTMNIRSGKGRSLIAFPDEYVSVDLETTGTSPRWDEIIEIGAARVRGGEVVETYQQLVNPGFEIDPYVVELTGITDEMVSNVPAIIDVLPEFVKFLGDSIMVGHNIAGFDANFLYDAGARIGIPVTNDFVDTMRLVRKLHKDWEHHRLTDLRERFGIDAGGAQRALADALATHKALECMRQEAIDACGSIEAFSKAATRRTKASSGYAEDFSDIVPTVEDFDDSHPFYGKEIVVTGSLGSGWTKRDAAQAVVNLGGTFSKTLRKKTTNYLVIADYSKCRTIKGGMSRKHRNALDYKAKGSDIEIIDADTFFDLVEQ